MIEQVTAFRTSDGRIFNDKVEAYHEEVVRLYSDLPVVGRRGYSRLELVRFLGEVDLWLGRCHRVRGDMSVEEGLEAVLVAFDALLERVGGWVGEARGLLEMMSTESDPEVSGRLKSME